MALTKIPASLLDTSSGFDLQGNITLGDSEKIRLGDGPDLDIYHDGSNSYIEDLGDGVLFVKASSGIYFNGKTTDEPLARFIENGAVNLYYDNNLRIATSSAGATVDGTLTVTGNLDITGDINSYNVTDLDVTDQTITLGAGQTEANSGGSGIIIDGSSASILWDETNDVFDINKGLTALGSVGIGTSIPDTLLELFADNPVLRLRDSKVKGSSWAAGDALGGLEFYTSDTTGIGTHTAASITAVNGGQNTSTPDAEIVFSTAPYNTAASEKVRIDSSGNVGIGTSSPEKALHIRSISNQLRLQDSTNDKKYDLNVDGNNFSIDDMSAGASRFTIKDGGNVGIGASSPEEKLHVLGQAVFENMGNTNRGNIIMGSHGNGTSKWAALAATHYNEATGSGNGSGNAGIMVIGSESAASYNKIWIGHGPYELNPATQINFGTYSATTHNLGGTTRMVIDSSGNVGIGTNNPNDILDIHKANSQLRLTDTDDSKFAQFSYSGAKLIVRNNSTDTTVNQTTLTDSGKVGIGTISPSSRLHVYSSAATSAPTDQYAVGLFDDDEGRIQVRATNSGSDGAVVGLSTGSHNWGLMATASGTFSNAFAIGYVNTSTDGNVFGVNSMSEKLIITTSGTMGFGMSPLGTNSGSAFFDGNVSSKDGFMTTAGDLTLLQPSAGNTIFVRDNGNETMRISSAGDLIYSTTGTTGSDLSNGGICFRDNGSQVYGQFASGTTSNVTFIYFYTKSGTGIAHIGSISHTGSTMSYGSASDYRLKENVVSLDSALSRVNQLQPKRFNFIADGDDTTVDGFIAHEVKEIVPEAITGEKDAVDDEGNPEYQTIDQSKLVPLLTKAIQEQQTIIDDLKARIEALEE